MDVAGNKPEPLVLKPFGKKLNRNFYVGVRRVHALEGLGVAGAGEANNVRAKSATVKPVNWLRRHQGALRLRRLRVGVGQKVRGHHGAIKENEHNSARHGQKVFAIAPPH